MFRRSELKKERHLNKMAKRKQEGVLDQSLFTTVTAALKERNKRVMLPLSPNIDMKLGGGILDGSLVLIQTFSGVGKTMLAVQAAENALAQGRYVVYADTEGRLDEVKYGIDRLHAKYGDKLLLLKSSSEVGVLTGNQIYEQIYKMTLIPKYNGTLYIIDSLSKTIPHQTLEDSNIIADRRDMNAKLNSDFCKKVGNFLRISNSICIGIQHLQKTQGQYSKTIADGGEKLIFEADIVLEAKHRPLGFDGKPVTILNGEDKIYGQVIHWQLTKNKLLGPHISYEEPIENFLKFGVGVWWEREALDVLKEMGLVAVSGGGWHKFMTEKFDGKVQGDQKAAQVLADNKEYFTTLINKYFIDNFGAKYDFTNNDNEEE
jgi:RecA/RadA recombinase